MNSLSHLASVRRARGAWHASVTLAIILAWASSAAAGIVGNMTLVNGPGLGGASFAAPDSALAAPWVSYKLSLTATGTDSIQAVEASITGPLHQRWFSSKADGVYDTPTAIGTNATNGDSHFLATPSMLFGADPTEDNSFTGSPLSPLNNLTTGYGVGTGMSASFGPGVALKSMDIAYLVFKNDDAAKIHINLNVVNQNGDRIAMLVGGGSPPSMLVSGNGFFISNGENTPSLAKGTDFGTVPRGSTQARTFDASDLDPFFSPLPLPLALGPPTFTGPFSLVGAFPSPSFYGGPFTIGLDTSVPGTYTGSISFATNDPQNNPFTFVLAATVVPEPASVMLAGLGTIGVIGLVVGRRR